ncbi:MAG: PrsW family glutamic-type intramembrane protease [Bacteroidetes bacterium]|nr:PrsW family glutamic-type intramembrane protease [Bacteroidota bacterium]
MIYQKDHEKEPLSLLLKCLLGGCLSTVLSLVMSIPLGTISGIFQGDFLSSIHQSFLEAAIPEELAKFGILYFLIWKSRELDHSYDGIVYSVFVSLGFAIIENILYVLEGGFTVAIVRAIFSVPGHGLFGVMMGYYFSLARFHEGGKRREFLIKSLAIPILFHGAYDFLLFYMGASSENILLVGFLLILFAGVIILLWRKGLAKVKHHLEQDGKLLDN